MKLTPALRTPKTTPGSDAGTAMARAVSKLSGQTAEAPAVAIDAVALAAIAHGRAASSSNISGRTTAEVLADAPAASGLIETLLEVINAPWSQEILDAHKAMMATYAAREVPAPPTISSMVHYAEMRQNLAVRLELARIGGGSSSPEDIQAEIDALEERNTESLAYQAKRDAVKLLNEERREAVKEAASSFQALLEPRRSHVKALAAEFDKLASVLIAAASAARLAVHYSLWATDIDLDVKGQKLRKEVAALFSPEVRTVFEDWRYAHNHGQRVF